MEQINLDNADLPRARAKSHQISNVWKGSLVGYHVFLINLAYVQPLSPATHCQVVRRRHEYTYTIIE